MEKFNPGVMFIQESNCRIKRLVRINGYIVFEKIRPKGRGGGLLTAVHSNLDPVVLEIRENIQTVLVVEAKVGNLKTRFINAYGPQEEESGGDKGKVDDFYLYMDLVIKDAKSASKVVCIQMDANAKLGRAIVPGDPKEQSKNGEKLLAVIEENGLVVVNALDLCSGVITRSRETVRSKEESVLDYFIVCEGF